MKKFKKERKKSFGKSWYYGFDCTQALNYVK